MQLGLTPDNRRSDDGAAWIAAARAGGFTSLGLSSLHLRDPEVSRLLAESGLGHHELMGLVVTDEDTTLGWAHQIVEQIGRTHPSWVNTTFKAVDGDTAALARRCSAMFAEAGAGMAIEFSPLGPVASLQDALDLADEAGHEHTRVVVDSWNVSYGPTTWEELERLPVERIGYVQFNDALPRVADLATEAMERRTYPGRGTFALERFADILRAKDFAGVVSVQILSAELRTIPLADFAREAREATEPYWR
jgi:sugar phosphate isomerase/epimerase